MNLLSIVPPYRHRHCPPAGAAALLGHLKAAGHDEVGFLDLRLGAPDAYMPTYDAVGLFGDSFVVDVPDLPLVLRILRAYDDGAPTFTAAARDDLFDTYCYERGLDPDRLLAYLAGMDRYLGDAFGAIGSLGFVGFSTWSSNYTTTLLAAAHLKRRRDPPIIVAGGPQVTESRAAARLGLDSGLFDAVVLGEGESGLLEAYRRALDGKSLDGIPGVLTRSCDASPRALLPLAQLADPSFDAMELAAYRSEAGELRLPFQLSRGCTDKCTFCSEWVFWEHFRPDTPDHAVEQLARLSARYDVHRFHFTDSLINGHMKRLRAFAEALLAKDLRVDWGGFMRADMDPDTARLLRRAGLSYAYIGVESLDDETLELMNKRRTRADNLRAIQNFLDAGINVAVGVIPGFPGDTRERFVKTAQILSEMSRENGGRFGFNVEPFIVSPGQPLFKNLAEVGLTSKPWDEAVLALAPKYRAITEAIACRVEGANQGAERSGQLRLLQLLLGGDSQRGVFDHREELGEDRMRFHRVGGPFELAVVKRRGRTAGVLIDAREKDALLSMVESGRAKESLFERAGFAALWSSIESVHLPAAAAKPVRWVRAIGEAGAIALSSFTAARIANDAVYLVHRVNLAVRVLPKEAAPILAQLAEEAIDRPALELAWIRAGLDPLQLAELLELGLLIARTRAVAAARPRKLAVLASAS